MSTYKYVAINQSGQTIKGQLDAGDRKEFDLKLAKLGLEPIQVKQQRLSAITIFQPSIGREELAQFCFYLEQLVKSGVPLIEGLTDLRDSVENKGLRNVTSLVIQEVESGTTLSNAMKKYPRYFDDVFVALIAAGEQSGELARVLNSLGETIRWGAEMTKRTRKVFLYPIFAMLVITGAGGFLLLFVVPPMTEVITGFGAELPPATLALIATSEFIQNYWAFIIASPFVAYVVIRLLILSLPGIDMLVDRLKIRFPVFGVVSEKIILSRFANTFGMLYSSGVSVVEALKIAEDTLGNRFMQRAVSNITQEIVNGKALSTAFAESGIFPPLVMRMMKLGETTGGVDSAMLQIKYYYDKDAAEAIAKAQAAIGPLLMVFIAGMLVWIILAIYAPLYDLFSHIG